MEFGTKHLSIFGILLFFAIIWKTNFVAMLGTVELVAPFWLFVVLVTIFLEVLIRAFRWQALASLYAPYPYKKALQTYLIGIAFGSITPAKIGDVVKILDLKKETGVPLKKALGIEVLDRAFDLLFLLLAGFIGIVAGYRLISGAETSLGLLGASILVLFGLGLFMLHGSSKFVYRLIYRVIVPDRFKEDAKEAYSDFRNVIGAFVKSYRAYLVGLLTFASWSLIFIRPYFVALALGIDIPWLPFLLFMPLATIVELLPISIMGLGTREGTLIVLFSLIGVPGATMVLISLLLVVLSIIPQVAVGYWIAIKKDIQIGDLK